MILLVVDVQKGLLDEELYGYHTFLDHVTKLIEKARKNHVEVIFMKHDAGSGTCLSSGDEGFEIADIVKPYPTEKVYEKNINSCFGNYEFSEYLKESGEREIMIIGLQTDFCIDATIKSAFERGYRVIVPEGANSTFDNDFMNGETTYRFYNEWIWPDAFAECVSFNEALTLLGER